MSVHFSASGKNLEMVSYARLPSVLGKDQDQPLPNKISLEYKLYALCTVPLVYIVIRSFAPNPIGLLQMHCDFQLGSDGDLEPTTVDTGMCVCPRKTICATSGFELFMLAMSRGSTYFAYPFYILIFLTKANNLNHAMNKAFISQFVPITSSHHVHQLGGFVIGIATLFHSFWHLLRWGLSGHMRSLITTQTGITGTICCILTFVIVWPMLLEPIRKVMSFEWRKGLHMLSWIWGISLALHAPATHVGAIIGVTITIYFLDFAYGMVIRTYQIDNTMLTRLESAVELQFERPANFDRFKAAYIYINVPWISKYEWHAFTVYENPNDPDLMSLCIAKNGDWTNKLHEAVKQPVVRPTWVLGPFDSPFRETGNYDHIFVIASGIGITPSVSIMNSYNRTRRVYLLWSIRDASLAEWFLDSIQFDDDSWNIIFYTGKRELVLGRKLPANVLILKGRPNLEKTIISIIQAVEHGVPLPADDDDDDEGSDHLGDEFAQEMKRLLLTYNKHELWDIVLGYENLQDKSATEVTLESITMMTTRLFKNPEKFSDDVLSEKFELLDTSKDSHLSYNEFKVYLDSLSDTFTKGSQGVPSARKSKSEFKEYLKDVALSKRAAKNDVIELADIETSRLTLDSVQLPQVSEGITTQSHWAMAYCGGVQPIVDQLKEISENHGISLDIEKFDW